MIIDSSGKDRKVWKSEVIGPAVIVYTGSEPHVGSSELTARAVNKQIPWKFVLFKNQIAQLGS